MYNKTASKPQPPEGFWPATVSSVDGNDVYVTVPNLSADFVHGPILYTGAAPDVDADAFVSFLHGNQDTVVAIFPGGGVSAAGPPIERGVVIASFEASPEMKAVADYVCDGVDDQVEFLQAVSDWEAETGIAYDRLVIKCTPGVYEFSDTLSFGNASVSIIGTGQTGTYLYFTIPETPTSTTQVIYLRGYGVLSDVYIDAYVPYSNVSYGVQVGSDFIIENVTADFSSNVPTNDTTLLATIYGSFKTLKNCVIHNFGSGYSVQSYGWNAEIESNYIYGAGAGLLMSGGGNYAEYVVGNTLIASDGYAVRAATYAGCVWAGNYIYAGYDAKDPGIFVYGSANIFIGNTIEFSTGYTNVSTMLVWGDNTTIIGNTWHQSEDSAIQAEGVNGLIISSNVAEGWSGHFVNVTGGVWHLTITDNMLYSSGGPDRAAISCVGVQAAVYDLVIRGNIIIVDTYGNDWPQIVLENCTDFHISSNVISSDAYP